MTDERRPAADAADLELLRHFEPVLRFTLGESFFPMSVAAYLPHAAQVRRHGSEHTTIALPGELTVDSLATDLNYAGSGREYLTVVAATTDDSVDARLMARPNQAVGFRRGGGRLARVGYSSRLIDALFSITLLARGRVRGTLARRSVEMYQALGPDAERVYYGRVVRSETWIALQYWFFYAFNDWRSGFKGANDHEADWEQILVYLYVGDDGPAVPRWVAYAQHDYEGRDLRRRWDDHEELELVGDHPVVNVGAGSHASYFRAGEYMTQQELRVPNALRTVINAAGRLLGGGGGGERILPIAFIDYARGDGESVGPGCERGWSPVVLDDDQRWASSYRGLWGISVQDPFEGEDAPAGPMFNRDGSVRSSWSHPIAFAELDAVSPPNRERTLLDQREAELSAQQLELAGQVAVLEASVVSTGIEQRYLVSAPVRGRSPDELQAARDRLAELNNERAANVVRLNALRQRRDQLQLAGDDPPQAHLRRIPRPAAVGSATTSRALEFWAASSVGLLLLALVAILLLAPETAVFAALVVIGAFVFVESLLQDRVADLLVAWTRLLAVVTLVLVGVAFWQQLVVVVAVAAGLFVLRENLLELLPALGRRRGRGAE